MYCQTLNCSLRPLLATLHLIETFATVTYAHTYIVAFRVPIAHKTVDTNYDKSDNCYKILTRPALRLTQYTVG
jgi:hypothetical protein